MVEFAVGRHVARVDDVDWPLVSAGHRWVAHAGKAGSVYASRLTNGRREYLHRLIMQATPQQQVDHIDGNGLDNRRCNLRVCTTAENMRNIRRGRGRSEFKGVAWFTRDRCWRAYIVKDYGQIHLGYFRNETEAAQAYDAAAIREFGEFARPNFSRRTVA